jgi:hypothetical protein
MVRHYLGRKLPKQEANRLALVAAWMRIASSVRRKTDVRALGLAGIESKGELLQLILDAKPKGLTISRVQVFKRKLTAWGKAMKQNEAAALDSLIHGHRKVKGVQAGNQAARKITETIERVLLSMWFSSTTGEKRLISAIDARYLDMAHSGSLFVEPSTGEVYGPLPVLGLTTVKDFFRQPEVAALAGYRHGSKFYDDTMGPYVYGARPKMGYSMSSSDGEHTPFRLMIKGKPTNRRAVAYLVFDVMSGAVIGYALGMEESGELMREAFRNMLFDPALPELHGVVPVENQLDNYNKGMASELEPVFPYVSYCAPYNSKSRYAETLIGRFKHEQLRNLPGYLGRPWAKDQSNVRDTDKATKHYTFEEIDAIYREAITAYNASWPARSNRSRLELLGSELNPQAKQIDALELASSWGKATILTVRRGFVTLQVDNAQYVYEVPDYHHTLGEMNGSWRVRVRYFEQDLSKVELFTFEDERDLSRDSHLCSCLLAQGTQRAKAEQDETDGQRLGHYQQRAKAFDQWAPEKAEAVPEELVAADEAEALLSDGYSGKAAMQRAEEALDPLPVEPKKKDNDIPLRWR